ncbi:MAG: hypothetical protein M3033_00450 [Acidobacteriota bacterium]|nr:hypothetical protein [Acidobacteriota bacterium]
MTTRKNYNSIVFLTTLSVYLGLVLVGAPAPVLAQAALTSRFEVKDKIEKKDDLDKKPDDEKIDFDESLNCYFVKVHGFFSDLKELNTTQQFNLGSDKFELDSQIFLDFVAPLVNPSISTENKDSKGLFLALNNINLDIGGCGGWSSWLAEDPSKSSATNSKLKISYDKTELKLEISVPKLTKQRADFLAERFNQAYRIYEVDANKPVVKIIYENTKISSANNKVIIVTRLPRGSLDALLAKDSAK